MLGASKLNTKLNTMRTLKELFISGLAILINFLFIYGEVFGIIHSVKKHSAGDIIITILIPPWAWYRSAEMWWHNDYDGVNWDKRLTNDMQSCVYFFTETTNQNANLFILNENLEKFSKKVNKYPKERKQFLIDGSRKYINYVNSLTEDLINSIDDFTNSQQHNFRLSIKTKELENEVRKFKLEEDILLKYIEVELNYKLLIKTFPDISSPEDINRFNHYKIAVKASIEKQRKELKRIFKSIFNEEV